VSAEHATREAHPDLRDGERLRKRWLPAAGSAILALLALVNLCAA
jgi:hypothetical protein